MFRDEGSLQLGQYAVTQRTVVTFLIRIGNKLITYDNSLSLKNGSTLSEIQVKYIQDIIFARKTMNLDISRKEVIQVISDIGQSDSYVQVDNHYDYLIWEERLPNPNRHERVIKYHMTTMEQSHICVLRQYHWHMMIEIEWQYLQWKTHLVIYLLVLLITFS